MDAHALCEFVFVAATSFALHWLPVPAHSRIAPAICYLVTCEALAPDGNTRQEISIMAHPMLASELTPKERALVLR